MSPVAREISLCYALLINFVAAGASRVSGDGVRRSLFAAGSARHIASSGQRRSEGNSQRGSWTVAYKTPSGFALPPGRLAGDSTIRGSQSSCVQVIHRRRPSCSRWTMSTAASTPSYDKGSMVSEDSDVAGSTQSPAKEKQADMKVTLLSGFLGAGKTTLMRNIIRQARKQELSLALIVNDMADVNIDAQMLFRGEVGREAGAVGDEVRSVTAADEGERAVAMQDGCICCTLREELISEVEDFTRGGRHEHLLIESTGISDPTPVAEALATSVMNIEFDEDGEVEVADFSTTEDTHAGGGPGRSFALDTLVTVVDATSFLDEVRIADDIEDRGLEAMEGDTRTIADLLVSQVEFANVILLNKADLIPAEEMDKVEGFVRVLNPTADIKRTVSSEVGLAEIMGTGQFDLDAMSQSAGWVQQGEASEDASTGARGESRGEYGTSSRRGSIVARANRHDDDDHHHTETFGIETFTFRAERPFHPERLMDFVMNHLPSVLRSKGFFWLATRNDTAGLWNHSGGSFASEDGGPWLNEDAGEKKDLTRGVDPRKSDRGEGTATARRNELVFIGLGMDQQGLTSELRECLLTDEEMSAGPAAWADLTDPFPPWNYDEEEGLEE